MAYTWPVTVAEVKAELNTTSTADDTELQGFIDAATSVVENITGPVASTAYTERHDGGQPAIVLTRYPVITVDSITEYDTQGTGTTLNQEPLGTATYTDDGYRVDLPVGVLTRTAGGIVTRFAPGTANVVVSYHAGQSTVPAAVRMAALEFIRRWWTSSQASGSVTYPVDLDQLSGQDLTGPSIRTLLAPYRKAPHV